MTYNEIKEALKKQRENVKYFTSDFYATFQRETRDSLNNFFNNGEFKPLYETQKSDFYIKNGPAYCIMLELINDSKNTYKIDYINENDAPFFTEVIDSQTVNFDTMEEAEKYAAARKISKIYNVNQID